MIKAIGSLTVSALIVVLLVSIRPFLFGQKYNLQSMLKKQLSEEILKAHNAFDEYDKAEVNKLGHTVTKEHAIHNDDDVKYFALESNLDGCGLHRLSAESTSKSSRKHANWTPPDDSQLEWLRAIKNCGKRFQLADIKFFGKFDESMRSLQCEHKVNHDQLVETLASFETIWFLGDSLILQQFYAMLCMLNTRIALKDMVKYKPVFQGHPDDPITSEYIYHHQSSTAASNHNTTRLLVSRFGYTWHKEENNLYIKSFPNALAKLTENDAIVFDASSHYNAQRAHLMERALNFVANMTSALDSKATIFYMEPTPEEWPTSNGMYAAKCYKKCKCQTLTQEQLEGHWNHSHVQHIIKMSEKEKMADEPSLAFFQKYLSPEQLKNYQNVTTTSTTTFFRIKDCYPDCLPATWRVILAHSILLKTQLSTTTNADNISNTKLIHIVPTFWQLMDKKTPSNAFYGDCTHKSQEAIFMMNQQLIRSMMKSSSSSLLTNVDSSSLLQKVDGRAIDNK